MNQKRVVLPHRQSKRQTNLCSLLLLLSVSLPLTWLAPLPLTGGIAVAQVTAEDREAEADRLLQQGMRQYQVSQFREALQSWQTALEIYREISDRSDEARTLNNIGAVNRQLGNYPSALDYYQQSLAIKRELSDRAGEAGTLNNIGNVNQLLGNYPSALDYYQQSLIVVQEIGDRATEAATLNNIGIIDRLLGNYPSALDYYQQSLVITRELGDRAGEAGTLTNIGNVNRQLGNYPSALDYYQQSLIVVQEIGDRAGEAQTLNNIGSVNALLGNYPSALNCYQQSLVIRQEIGNRAGEAETLNNIGNVNYSLGNYPSALDYYQQSLVIRREIGNRAGEAETLNNIGNVNYSLGNYLSALDYYQQSLGISQNISNRAEEAQNFNNIGNVNQLLGNYLIALNYYQQSLVITREIGDRAVEAITLNNIGEVNRLLGNYPSALDYYQQSLVITREIGDRATEAATLNNIGNVNQLLGNYPIALNYYQQSLVITREIGDRATEAATLNNIGITYHDLGQYQQAEDLLFEALAILESIRTSELAEEDRVSLFETQRKTYATLQTVLIAQNQPEKALEVAERGRARILLEQLVAGLNSQSETQLPVDLPKFADIQRIAQQQQATLVEYSLVSIREESLLYIWVVKPTGELTFHQVALSESDASLANLVSRSRETIGVRSRGGFEVAAADDADQAKNLKALHQILIEPIAALLPSDPLDRVIFIPQDALFLVPFAALQDASGDYLIERHTILTAPSIQMLDLAQQQRQLVNRSGALQPSELLLVGNPTMPSVWQSQDESLKQLSRLPGAEAEARAIAGFFDTQALLGNDATESFVRQAIPSARVVHLATHGLLEYGKPEDSGRLDIPGAIALAPDAANDGLLTSAEIRTLDLNAELVVLSACDTGLGTITGDGVIGLARSLLLSGTPSVIVSLWSVPDAPTADLMVEFYRQWQQEGVDKAQALRQAMLSTMATHPDPRDWAAFTLIGEAE